MSTTTLERPPVAHRAAGVAMPIKKARIELDQDGYPGWFAVVRTNPRSAVMDDYRSGDNERWWNAMQQLVLEWNFCDEEGQPIPLPKDGTTAADLPEDLLGALMRGFREAFNAQSQPPKESSETSTPISTTGP